VKRLENKVMIEIVVAVCLFDEPNKCKDVSLNISDEAISSVQCMMGMGAQAELEKWLQANPKWTIKKWTCSVAGQVAKI
jgi:hypothetical protein